MKERFPPKLFVTGTNTDIGKTVVSAILVAGLRAHYWKPIQSGIIDTSDTQWIRGKTGLPVSHFYPEAYRLREPLSPHAAAALDGVQIALDRFEIPEIPEGGTLIVEGAGGIMVPLNDKHFMLDLIKQLGMPVLLVADSELGTINHTLLSLAQLRRHDVSVWGVVMNGPENPGNRNAIERYGKVPVRAEVLPIPEITAQSLADCFRRCFSA